MSYDNHDMFDSDDYIQPSDRRFDGDALRYTIEYTPRNQALLEQALEVVEQSISALPEDQREQFDDLPGFEREEMLANAVKQVIEQLAAQGGPFFSETDDDDDDDDEEWSMDEVLEAVVAGMRGDTSALVTVTPIIDELRNDPELPGDLRALGEGLKRLLSGERNADRLTAGMPEDVADLLRDVLDSVV